MFKNIEEYNYYMSPRHFAKMFENPAFYNSEYNNALYDGIDPDASTWVAFAFMVGLKKPKKINELQPNRLHEDIIARNTQGNRSTYE